jgi:hypothetical protein
MKMKNVKRNGSSKSMAAMAWAWQSAKIILAKAKISASISGKNQRNISGRININNNNGENHRKYHERRYNGVMA